MRSMTRRFTMMLLVAGLASWAWTAENRNNDGGGGDSAGSKSADPPTAINAIWIINKDPASPVGASRRWPDPETTGPFAAYDTPQVWIVVQYDRRMVGAEPFDQRVTLYLPDGNIYQRITTPIDPFGLGGTIDRSDISPISVGLSPLKRSPGMSQRPRQPGKGGKIPAARYTAYTQVPLPVAGTWITQHNLFGNWTVVVDASRDGQPLGQAQESTTFNGR
jgi:hypothetical protein